LTNAKIPSEKSTLCRHDLSTINLALIAI